MIPRPQKPIRQHNLPLLDEEVGTAKIPQELLDRFHQELVAVTGEIRHQRLRAMASVENYRITR